MDTADEKIDQGTYTESVKEGQKVRKKAVPLENAMNVVLMSGIRVF